MFQHLDTFSLNSKKIFCILFEMWLPKSLFLLQSKQLFFVISCLSYYLFQPNDDHIYSQYLLNSFFCLIFQWHWQANFSFDLCKLSIFRLHFVARTMQFIKIQLNTTKNINKVQQFIRFNVGNYFSSHVHVTGNSLNTESVLCTFNL